MATDDELLAEILPVLEIDMQVVRHFDSWDDEGIAQFRRVGRKAVKHLGHRAITTQSDPAKRDDGRVVVVVLADADDEHPDAKRLSDRGEELIRNMRLPFGEEY